MHLPGAGVGGHCLPKDSWLLKYGVDTYGATPVEAKILTGARAVNDSMPLHMADLAEAALRQAGIPLSSAKIAILGYAFLEESDDTRNTPARPSDRRAEASAVSGRSSCTTRSFGRKSFLK